MSNKLEIARLATAELSRKDRAKLLAILQPGVISVATSPERILRRREVAEKFSVSLRAVDVWAREGLLPKVRLNGRTRSCGFRLSDVETLMGVSND